MPESTAVVTIRIAQEGQSPSHCQTAMDRLSLSRARLRDALMPADEVDTDPQARRKSRSVFQRIETGWRRWRRHGTPLTALNMVLKLWGGRPTGQAQAQGVGLIVRAHPVLCVAVAATAGASLVLARPWRWGPVRHVALSARLQVTDLLVTWLVRAPLQRELAALLAEWTQPANDPASDPPTVQRQPQEAEAQPTAA